MAGKTVYFTFPISILKNGFFDIQTCCNNVMDYVGYTIASKLELGTNVEKMKDAGKQLCLKYGDNSRAYNNGKILNTEHYGGPVTSISHDILFDYYKNSKNEFQIACLLGFAAFKSILQAKTHCKTNKGLIHARMCGYPSIKDLPNKLSETERKYTTRYHIDKVIRELQHNWYLKTFSNHARGLYFGFEKTSLIELARLNENAKKKTKDAKLKLAKAEALAQVKAEMAVSI